MLFPITADTSPQMYKIWQPPVRETLTVQSRCLSANSICRSVYEIYIAFFRISNLLHPLLLRLTIVHWNSITTLASSVLIHRGVLLHTGTYSFENDIYIYGILLLPVTQKQEWRFKVCGMGVFKRTRANAFHFQSCVL